MSEDSKFIETPIVGPNGIPLPDGHILREPGVNAPEDDPRFVDEHSYTTEHNVERARAMATDGDDYRSEAALDRKGAHDLEGVDELADTANMYKNHSGRNDEQARNVEEAKGHEYDDENKLQESLGMSLAEFFNTYRIFATQKERHICEFIEGQVIFNDEFALAQPELLHRIYEKLATDPLQDLRETAAIGINRVFDSNPSKGVDILKKLLADESSSVVSEAESALDGLMLNDKFKALDPSITMPILKEIAAVTSSED